MEAPAFRQGFYSRQQMIKAPLGAAVRLECPAMLSKELLDILICPACRRDRNAEEALAYDQQRQVLKCAACHRAYPVRDDIPVLLIDEAKIEQ